MWLTFRKQTGRWARMILPEPEPLFATTIILSTTRVRTNVSRTQWQILSAQPPGKEGELQKAAASVGIIMEVNMWCQTGTRHQQSALFSRKSATMATEQNPHEVSVCLYTLVLVQNVWSVCTARVHEGMTQVLRQVLRLPKGCASHTTRPRMVGVGWGALCKHTDQTETANGQTAGLVFYRQRSICQSKNKPKIYYKLDTSNIKCDLWFPHSVHM